MTDDESGNPYCDMGRSTASLARTQPDEAAIRADERAKVIRECAEKLLAEARRSDHDEGYPPVRARYFAEAADLIEEDGDGE